MLLIVATVVFLGLAHADPGVVLNPNGTITIIYPSQNGMPAMAIAPNGGVTYAYPSTAAPITVLPIAPPTPSPLSMPPMPHMMPMTPIGGMP
jgi:hypothetical protein